MTIPCRTDQLFGVASEDPYLLAMRAYAWGYSWWLAGRVRQNLTSPQAPCAPRDPSSPGGPINQLGHQRALSDPRFRAGVAPNVDTLYSLAWLDLDAGPFVLEAPEISGRYYTFQLAFGDTSTEQSVGSRTHGARLPPIVIAGPTCQEELPARALVVRSHTRYFQIAGRILVNGTDEDLARVHALQQGLRLRTLASYLSGCDEPPPVSTQTRLEEGAVPDNLQWLRELGNVLDCEHFTGHDEATLEQLAPIGLSPRGFDGSAVRDDVRSALVRGLADGREAVRLKSLDLGCTVNGWTTNYAGPRFGDDYLLRSAVAKDQIYVTVPEEALYPVALVDNDGERLHGSRRYTITFPPGHLPPVRAFWSLTMYHADGGGLCDNPIARYSIGDRTRGLDLGADGSLAIAVQHDQPTDAPMSNWLPSPPGPFHLMLRLYVPEDPVLEGAWTPPPVVRRYEA